ncbi:hypothetical protein [Streptomyces clavuligerus]|uniref:hypothetical protein n=1 Tax=Streptomyces clavuligerus TaxID=1901 RepID=UPI001F0743E0|nr:hypothetical protein [Streptomyces clavuligerus]
MTAVATEALALGYKQCATLADTALTALDNWHRRPRLTTRRARGGALLTRRRAAHQGT